MNVHFPPEAKGCKHPLEPHIAWHYASMGLAATPPFATLGLCLRRSHKGLAPLAVGDKKTQRAMNRIELKLTNETRKRE